MVEQQSQTQPQSTPQAASAQPKKKNTALIIVLVIIGLCILCSVGGAGVYILFKDRISEAMEELVEAAEEASGDSTESSDEPESLSSSTDDEEADEESDEEEGDYDDTQQVEEPGTITGSLGYPSSFIPEDMEVCAEDPETGRDFKCTSDHTTTATATTYSLDLSPGTYYIYASTSDWSNYKAYYSEAVECGLSVDCDDHTPIEVEVEAGETVTGVDPTDWYDPDQY